MRLLVEPSDYIFRNAGDMAMMRVAISRLVARWPNASIEVFTADPNLLAVFCPAARPLLAPQPGKPASVRSPGQIALTAKRLLSKNNSIRQRLAPVISYIRWNQNRYTRARHILPTTVLEAISRADAMVVTGMGGVTDAFPEYALGLLKRIEQALAYGKPVVMLGQGVGPIENPQLRSKAMAVLPRVPLIALREGRSGIPLLRSLGVDTDRVIVTGDDAIELAISARSPKAGSGLGINLRAAAYAAVDAKFVPQCRGILQRAARMFGAPMVPVPISTVPGEEDILTIQWITTGYSDILNDGVGIDTPIKVIDQIKSCRALFAGSYHAAVFALSLGMPVICLARSDYYRDKFLGLAELFGSGCEVILAREPNWQPKLAKALERAWYTADEVKPQLLAAAERQLRLSRAAYQKAFDLLCARATSNHAAI